MAVRMGKQGSASTRERAYAAARLRQVGDDGRDRLSWSWGKFTQHFSSQYRDEETLQSASRRGLGAAVVYQVDDIVTGRQMAPPAVCKLRIARLAAMSCLRRVVEWPHLPLVVFNIALPLILFNVVKEHASQMIAVFVSGIPPMAKTLVQIICYGQKDVISIVQIISTCFSVVILFFTDNAKVLLIKDSLSTITIGVLHFLSLAFFHEDMFFTFRRHFTSKTAADMDLLYAKPHVRKISRTVTSIWGVAMIIEACIRIALVLVLSVQTMVYISPIIPIVCFWPLMFWTFKYIQHHENDDGSVKIPLLAPNVKELEQQVDSLA
ncbi:unnamed protein product [Aphanomyces euteiches]